MERHCYGLGMVSCRLAPNLHPRWTAISREKATRDRKLHPGALWATAGSARAPGACVHLAIWEMAALRRLEEIQCRGGNPGVCLALFRPRSEPRAKAGLGCYRVSGTWAPKDLNAICFASLSSVLYRALPTPRVFFPSFGNSRRSAAIGS